jgi:lathosterol oxidase
MSQFAPFSPLGLLLTTGLLSLFMLLRYALIAGFFYWALWVRPGNLLHARPLTSIRPPLRLVRHEIFWSAVSTLVYAFAGALMIAIWRAGYTQIYTAVSEHGWLYLLASLPVYLFLHDAWFYWTHRAMHNRYLFPVMHKVHHESRQPTPWAGFSFHPTEAIVGAVFIPVLICFLPIHIGVLIFLLVLMSVVGVTNHAGYEILPAGWLRGRLGEHWVSATHHNLHHQNYRSNFALYFRFWDRLMDTDEMPALHAAVDAGAGQT